MQKLGLVALDGKGEADVVMMASLMKQWLRELKDGIVPKDLYEELARSTDRKSALIAAIEGLPRINRHTLRFLMEFLADVSQYQDINKMSQNNVAIVFGPCIFKCPSEVDGNIPQASIIEESKNVTDFVMLLFEYYEKRRGQVHGDGEKMGLIKQSSKESLSSKLSDSTSSLNQREGFVAKNFNKDGTRKSEARKSKLSSSPSKNSFKDDDEKNNDSKSNFVNILNDMHSIDNLKAEESLARDDSFYINYETQTIGNTSSPFRTVLSPSAEDFKEISISASNSANILSEAGSINSESSSVDADETHDGSSSRPQAPPPLKIISEFPTLEPVSPKSLTNESAEQMLSPKTTTRMPSRQQTIIPQKNQPKNIIKDELLSKRSSLGNTQNYANSHSKQLVNMFKSKRYTLEVGNLNNMQGTLSMKNNLQTIGGEDHETATLSRSQTLNKKQFVPTNGEFTENQKKLLSVLGTINLDDITPQNLEDVKYMFKTLYNKLYVNLDGVVAENSKDDLETYNQLKYIIKSLIY